MDQLVFDVPRQVAEIEEAEATIAEQEAQTPRIVALVLGLRLMLLRHRIRRGTGLVRHDLARAAQAQKSHWRRSRLLLQRYLVAWLEHGLLAVRRLAIRLDEEREVLRVLGEAFR